MTVSATPLRVLHLAASNRWTGASAPALAEVEALRAAGIDAHFAYVGGYKMERRIGSVPFTHTAIRKKQDPLSFVASARALAALVERLGSRIVHAHLTYDHILATTLRSRGVAIVRTFHARRTLRTDPLTRKMVALTAGVCVVNESFAGEPLVCERDPVFTPPPVDHRIFSANGPDARDRLGIPPEAFTVGFIGKVVTGRGFEAAIDTAAILASRIAEMRLLIIGNGPGRSDFQQRAVDAGIGDRVVWAGYHDHDLGEYYRAADMMLFTAAGSDEGHRAISEAMACGRPVAAYPLAGVSSVLGPLAPRLTAADATPESLAGLVEALRSDAREIGVSAERRARAFGFEPTTERLLDLYSRLA
jgi:glycosyltransferase involved in cell wall biosynthesis